MDKSLIFNKPHNVLGSIDTDLILQTKGNIKIRWHNRKFIDLIKNGKLNTKDSLILNKVVSLDDINDDGIYLVTNTGEVILSVDGLIVNLSNLGNDSYISFLVPQDLTLELKYQALANIGFYYATLEDAKAANIQLGLVYIVDELKLYIAKSGELIEFSILSSSVQIENPVLNFEELWIGDLLHLYNESDSIIDAVNKLTLSIGKDSYIVLGDKTILASKELIINSIRSTGSDGSRGFRLYYKDGKSVLEVDDIIWRNKPEDEEVLKNSRILDESITFSEHDNLIIKADFAEFTTNGNIITPIGNKVICKLKYVHKYKPNLFIYIYKLNEESPYIIKCSWSSGDSNMKVTINSPYPEDIELKVTFEDGSASTIIIPANLIEVLVPNSKYVEYWEVVKGPSIWSDGVNITSSILNKAIPKEYKILETTDESFTIEVPEKELQNFVKSAFNSIVTISLKPYIQIKDNNLTLLDRSVIKEGKPDETVHTNIGIIKEDEIQGLAKCPEELTEKDYEASVLVGIYSDNFIGLNSKMYDTIFKKRCDYPKYDKVIEIPKDFSEDKYNFVIPNIYWIKELLKLAIPPGTIAMFNGQLELPKGWVICDGTNGTPNLVGRFVKAVATTGEIGENASELNENNEFTLTLKHLPKHSHPHNSHTHTLSGNLSGNTGESGNLSVSLNWSDYNWGIGSTLESFASSVTGEGVSVEYGSVNSVSNILTLGGEATGGNHSHSVSVNAADASVSSTISTEKELTDTEWPNKPIKIEPRSYSLIFIMKVYNETK